MLDRLESSDSILTEQRHSCALVITFGGFHHGIGAPLFEFFRTLQTLRVNRVFVRDFAQAWYHAGVVESPSIDALAVHLRSLSDDYRRVVAIGNSMGGYAALIFGWLLGADEVLAFTPQTNISADFRASIGDTRWQDRMDAIAALPQRREDLYDLRSLARQSGGFTRAQIYYSDSNQLDVAHANWLSEFPGITLTCRKSELGHQLVQELRDSGELQSLLRTALQS